MLSTTRRENLRRQLQTARSRTDELFTLIRPEALYDRPIPERHRIVFYLGHLETFDWNMICSSLFEMEPIRPDFDKLFAFGIDPTSGNLPNDKPADWPRETEIHRYNKQIRDAVDSCVDRAREAHRFEVVIEHRLMHAETLTYMCHRLPVSLLQGLPFAFQSDAPPFKQRMAEIPAGIATLGIGRDDGAFGWDNEFNAHDVAVTGFAIDTNKVTNADYLEFVRAGGYQQQSLWNEAAWKWIQASEIRHPLFWGAENGGFRCRSFFAEIPFQPAWPVYVSHAEAEAFARWKGKSLPTEAQFHRAAFGTPDGSERLYPWGGESPEPRHGNFDFRTWDPVRVDAHPEGKSAFGVAGLVGNGWEWTSTKFAPFDGFKRFEFYPGYSVDFFDGNHYVMKGGSARTAARLLRRSFRNFFQPLYQNPYAGFRCVDN